MKPSHLDEYELFYNYSGGCFDALQIEPSGFLRVNGWRLTNLTLAGAPVCYINNQLVPLSEYFRTYRPDIVEQKKSESYFTGSTYVFRLPQPQQGIVALKLMFQNQIVFQQNIRISTNQPHYNGLFDTTQVLHRKDIYQEGAPVNVCSPEVLSLVSNLPGPILDFGCGVGNLVKFLRDRGIEAYGVEIDRPAISEHIIPEVRDYITLDDGKGKLPFADKQFKSAVAIEVFEHIPEYEKTLQEIARVTSDNFIISVPDASSIPLCYPNIVVPWHLLEGTHVNFFTQKSLQNVLGQFYSNINFGKIGRVEINNSSWYVSLLAMCQKVEPKKNSMW